MTRWHWMTAKMYAPTLMCLFVALAASWMLSSESHSVFLVSLARKIAWIPFGLFAMSALLGIVATLRLRRWELGTALMCACGGLLGREREGRYGPYRKCMACGRNHASN